MWLTVVLDSTRQAELWKEWRRSVYSRGASCVRDSCFLPSLNTILDSLKTVNYWVLIIVHARHCSKHVPELSNLMLQLSWVAISLPISFWILKSRSKLFKCCVQGHRPSQASTWTQEVWIFRAMPHSQQLHTYLLKGIFHPLWFYCWALRCS